MSAFLHFLAEIAPSTEVFFAGGRPEQGIVAAGIIFLLLLCSGVVLDLALLLYLIKRPPNMAQWCETLKRKALPGKWILILVLVLVACYASCAAAYYKFFPYVEGTEPSTLIFQALFFNLPTLLVISWILLRYRAPAGELPGTCRQRAPSLAGLSVLFYLATVPILWCYGVIYQLFLNQFGFDFYLQDVAQIFLMPSPALERMALYSAAIILVPVSEELLFRGMLLPWIVRRLGFWPGIATVSLVFAAIHMHLPSFLPLFLLSVFFCVAYARTRSLLVPIGMHACFNAVSTLTIILTGGQ